ncbi:hypothetical protein [Parafrankia sp. BMG5.11]|uniref:hypothetical protein n=1 Tax=Parafrankia sp. BMG5.11 TaxID=222540 RepID=UPI001FB3F1E7|nr:hypothetical protein [Parafrankia sp. BMG5.11]
MADPYGLPTGPDAAGAGASGGLGPPDPGSGPDPNLGHGRGNGSVSGGGSAPGAGGTIGSGLAEIPDGPLVPTMPSGATAPTPRSGSAAAVPPRPGAFVPRELDHPLVAANRYRELMGASDAVRARLAESLAARQEGHDVIARRHRSAADDIRTRIGVVWGSVGGSLAPHGLGELDQVRPRRGEGPDLEAVYQRYAGDLDGLDRGRGGRPTAVTIDAAGGRRASRGSRARGVDEQPSMGQRGGKRLGAASGGLVGADGLVDPERAKKLAYRLCLEVMARSAELRAVTKGASGMSAGLVTALCCALGGALTVAARVFVAAPALPCLAAAGGVGAIAVVAATGSSAAAAVRSALLAAAAAAVAVFATFGFVPIEPAGAVGSLAVLALALRFGLGFGAATGSSKPTGQGGSGRR